jgi:hypothetical protein
MLSVIFQLEIKWCSRFKWYSNQVENELYICWFSWFRWNASEVASYFYATLCYCKCYQMLSATVSATLVHDYAVA